MKNQKTYFLKDYVVIKKIDEGSYGKVFRAYNKNNHKVVAIKLMDLDYIKINELEKKVENEELQLRRLKHPNIIKLVEVFKTECELCFVLEYCNAKNLGDFLEIYNCKSLSINEKTRQKIMREVVSAICFMHQNNCFHRDIKPQNIMITFEDGFSVNDNEIVPNSQEYEQFVFEPTELTPSVIEADNEVMRKTATFEDCSLQEELDKKLNEAVIKIIDFGFARDFKDESTKSFCGNPISAPPELFNDVIEYDYRFDIWGLGALGFNLMTFDPPFQFENGDFAKLKLKMVNSLFNLPNYFTTSIELLDFIDRLLIVESQFRMNWKQIITHPFLINDYTTFTFKEITIKSDYKNFKGMKNKGLVEILDSFKEDNTYSIKELIKNKIKHVEDIELVSKSIKGVDLIQLLGKKKEKLSEFIKEDYFDSLFPHSHYSFLKPK